ncbi:MAG: Lrp/AsnC family transcriptional regulator [Pseudomonadota bacterium]
MDELDDRLLSLLVTDSSTPISQLARKLNVARSTVQARLIRLETEGVVAGYTIRLGEAAARRRIKATVLVSAEPRTTPAVLQRLKPMMEVESCVTSTGRVDLILTLVAEDTAQLDAVLDRIGAIPGVVDTESLIHLSVKWSRGV